MINFSNLLIHELFWPHGLPVFMQLNDGFPRLDSNVIAYV